MAKGKARRGTLTRVGQGATGGQGVLRRYEPDGAVRVTLPHAPTQQRALPLKGKKASKAKTKTTKKRAGTGKRSGGSGSRTSNADAVTQIILAALAGGPLRLAIEDIAQQIYWELQSEQQSAMQQSGSYQRLGGF